MQPSSDPDPIGRAVARRSRPRYSERALAIWPGLDRDRLARTRGDPARITRLVMSRTSLSWDGIFSVLTRDSEAER